MEGGIAILLLVVVLALAGVVGFFLFGTGGFLWKRKTDPTEERVDRVDEADARPEHTQPTDPVLERTEFVGTKRAGG